MIEVMLMLAAVAWSCVALCVVFEMVREYLHKGHGPDAVEGHGDAPSRYLETLSADGIRETDARTKRPISLERANP